MTVDHACCRITADFKGTPEDPVVVTSAFTERVVGVPDPEDDCLVVWSLIKKDEPPRQIIPGGEYFVLKQETPDSWTSIPESVPSHRSSWLRRCCAHPRAVACLPRFRGISGQPCFLGNVAKASTITSLWYLLIFSARPQTLQCACRLQGRCAPLTAAQAQPLEECFAIAQPAARSQACSCSLRSVVAILAQRRSGSCTLGARSGVTDVWYLYAWRQVLQLRAHEARML